MLRFKGGIIILKRKWFILAALSLVISMSMAGCGKKNNTVKDDLNAEELVMDNQELQTDESVTEEQKVAEDENGQKPDEITWVYIGNEKEGYKEYAAGNDENVTPEFLIDTIEEHTGWNLSLSEEVSSGKAGMTVMFSKDSALVTGPPENQKDEFRVEDSYGLVQTILDSIQTTFRKNYVMDGGDENSFKVWFGIEGEDIKVEDLVISHTEPWDEQDIF